MATIVGIVGILVGPATELGKFILAPIMRQFNYPCCFNGNIQSLRDEAKQLRDIRDELQGLVGAAERNAEVIVPQVLQIWLASADNEIEVNMSGIEIEISKVQSGNLTINSRFLLSRKAKKKTKAMKELREQWNNFVHISQPAPPPAIAPIPLGPTYEFKSRNQIEEDVMEALRGNNKVSIMGICGMGGIGKTTMAKRIMNRVREERVFDEVVMAIISQHADMINIQREIAESLGLRLEVETLFARAHQLRARLSGTKRTLIVLDDIWEMLEPKDLGIPDPDGHCNILLTSRDMVVLQRMKAERVFPVEILSEKEAWFLFRENIGTCGRDENLSSIAKEVAKECHGLPVALVTVGKALENKEDRRIWEDALEQLKVRNPRNIPYFAGEVYNSLKLSYDFLENERAKSLFLLCCLFPEDHNIGIEYLTWYIMGLGTLEGITKSKHVRNRVCSLLDTLKSRFLLLDGSKEHRVKMHDVVRDVGIFIASDEGRLNLNFSSKDWSRDHSYTGCTWISVIRKKRIKFPKGSTFTNLRLLLIDNSENVEFEMDNQLFEGMKRLNVLALKSIRCTSLPQTIELLKDLSTLILDSCTLETISVVGKLPNLKILSCRSCHKIKEVPLELGKLRQLRLLEFFDCPSLETIAPGIISNLVQLKELKMIGSFKKWEPLNFSGEKTTRNVSLDELKSLGNLTCLEIEMYDYTLAAEKVKLSSKIAKYDIRIYGIWPSDISTHEKKMFLDLPKEITLGNWIRGFLSSTEFLDLTGDGSNGLNLKELQKLEVI